jgi:hypothetical protein
MSGLLRRCNHVVAIHGCGGDVQQAFVGGLDESLKAAVARAIADLGLDTRLRGHQFPATDPNYICNRGRRGVGVQIEMTMALRLHGPREAIAAAIRSVLLALPMAPGTRGSLLITSRPNRFDDKCLFGKAWFAPDRSLVDRARFNFFKKAITLSDQKPGNLNLLWSNRTMRGINGAAFGIQGAENRCQTMRPGNQASHTEFVLFATAGCPDR